jgi:ribosome biogenesis protein SSF1/2
VCVQERRANKLKDYTTMAGPLGVTHLFLFSRSKTGNVHLRVAVTPRGPTMTFRVERYALCKDIAKAQKHPRGGGKEYHNAPLLVMNNFTSPTSPTGKAGADADPVKKQLESLTTTIFQSMFPPINPQTTPLNSIKRILLLNREPQAEGTYMISLRHYAITTRQTGVSKRVRRFDPSEQRLREKKTGALPNLGRLDDVADYLLDPSAAGYTSASETELDTDAEVEVEQTTTQRVLGRRERQQQQQQQEQQQNDDDKTGDPRQSSSNANVEKRAVKLVELGPRMRLRLVKVEEGICEGRVMWNEFVTKTKAQEKELDEKWDARRKEKEARRKEQRENIERKKALKKNTKANAGGGDAEDEDEEEWDTDELEAWDDDLDDVDVDEGQDEMEDEDEDEDEEMED